MSAGKLAGYVVLYAILALAFFTVMGTLFKGCATTNNMVNDGFNTIEKQFKPSELLRKYEWFKDASAQADQKLATLHAYESRFSSLKREYGPDSTKRHSWSRTDLEQWNVWESEYLGVKASYNDLSAQYNSAMAKFNYAFCNVGQLPPGAEIPLPREYKPYISN